jgi:flavin reductase (DIM6/NTAB) family NADH-FMN oxidoreductase RutF
MFTNGVYIILTGTNDNYQGMSIAWVSQIEKDHLIISAPKGALATNLLLDREMFSVNELGIGQEDLARQFGGNKCDKHPILNIAQVEPTEHNLPIIINCSSSTICCVSSVVEINEQVVITAKMINSQNGSDMAPLIFNKAVYFK